MIINQNQSIALRGMEDKEEQTKHHGGETRDR